MKRALLFLLTTVAWAQTHTHVNVGGPSYTDTAGTVWAADTGCDASTYARGNNIGGTVDPTLYQTGRQGNTVNCTYAVTTPGFYYITYRFAETLNSITPSNPRVMNLQVNGVTLFANLDVRGRAGINRAVDITVGPIALFSSPVVVTVTTVSNPAMLSAVSVDLAGIIGASGSIPVTSSALRGDGGGAALAVAGTGTNCVHVDGTSAACGSGVPAGVDTNIQFNDSGAFGGDTKFTANKTTGALTLNKISCTGSPVTCTFYDDTAVTGVSVFTIRAGAGQSTTALMTVRDAANNIQDFIDNTFAFSSPTAVVAQDNVTSAGIGLVQSVGLQMSQDRRIGWGNGTGYSSTMDSGLCRAGVGVVAVNDGSVTCNSYRDLILRSLTSSTLSGSGTRCVHVDNTGLLGLAAADCGSGGTPGGANTNIQFNDSSAFGGDAKFTVNKTTGAFTLGKLTCTGSTVTCTVYDDTATTGATVFTIRAGAGQSTTALMTVRDSSNNIQDFIDNTFAFSSPSAVVAQDNVTGAGIALVQSVGLQMSSDRRVGWGNGTGFSSTMDSGLCRGAAGQLNVNDGSTTCTNLRDFLARTLNSGDGTVAGEDKLLELSANGSNYRSWLAPDTLTADLRLKFPDTTPSADAIMLFPAPTTSVSQFAWISFPSCADSGGNHLNFAASAISCGTSVPSTVVQTGQANTYTTGAQDFGSATSLKIPVAAGLTTATNGFIGYDSTNNMLHAAQSSADAKIPQFTATPANNDCAKWTVSGSNYKLDTAGSACGGSSIAQTFFASGAYGSTDTLSSIIRPVGSSTIYENISGRLWIGSTTESYMEVPIGVTGTAKNACVLFYDVQDAGGNLTVTLRLNGADTTLVVTFTAGSGTAATTTKVCDTTHTVSISGTPGSEAMLSWKIVQAGATSAYIAGIEFQLQ